jgi:DHA1 family bicyclomycin/chloramphenicol resistance-like MFS transporter
MSSEPSQQAPEVEIKAPSSLSTSSKSVSIYHLYTIPHRRVILAAAALLALLTPFTDTVYLPALIMVGEDFDTTDSMVALTVSIYLACVGLGQLLWGPLADRYGRHSILIWALIAYLGLTIGCIFSTSIEMFLVLRSLQVSPLPTTVSTQP